MNRRRQLEDDYDDRPRKRRRQFFDDRSGEEVEVDQRKNIEKDFEALIVQVGNKSTKSIEKKLQELAEVLDQDPSYKEFISQTIFESVVIFAEKTSIYSTLVGLINARNFNFGGEIVELLVKNLKEFLKTSKYEEARVLIRFFSDLVNCHVISSASLMNLFENLVDVTMEDNIPQARSDYFVFTVLSALPWVGRELYDKKEQDLEQLLNTIDNYFNKRQKTHHHTALRVWYSDNPHPQEEYLDCLWAQISKFRSDKWIEHRIYRPYLAFDNFLCEALQHNLPQLQPPPHESHNIYPYPRVVFRLFDYTDCPEGPVLPAAHSIERFLIEENLRWIINRHHESRKDCASNLLLFPGKQRIPLEYMIVEVMFSELFGLPKTKFIEIYYGSLFLELCKLQPSTIPQVLAQAVELLFERIDTMNAACIDRFASWFAYHLSNFQFRWSWEDWASCVSLDPLHPKPKFVRETLLRCMRLSYHQKVVDFVPEAFSELVPKKPAPINKFDVEDDSIPGYAVAQKLKAAILNRCTVEEALEIVNELPNSLMETDDEPTHHPLKIDVFVTILLNVASKSFTHCFAALLKFQDALLQLNTSEEAQICIIKAIFEVWHNHQQIMVVLNEKLMKAGVIECSAVAKWIFSKENSDEFMNPYIWEMLHATIRRTIKTVEKCQKELDEVKEKLKKVEAGEADEGEDQPTEETVERLEEKLESAQSDQKNLFLIIFQRFIMLLSEHIQNSEAQGKSFKNHWFRWTIGRLQQVFFEHHEHVFKYVTTFESLLFTADLDQHILLIFKQFCSLRS